MKVENLKIFKNASLLASSVALAVSLTAIPAYAYADEVEDNAKPENVQDVKAQEQETKTEDSVKFEGTYETQQEAINTKDTKEQEYQENGYENIESEITKTTTTEQTDNIVEEYVDSTVTTEKDAYTFDNEADANAKKEELESSADGHDVVITVDVNKNTKESGEYDTKEVNETYNSNEEAQNALSDLENDGYEITDSSITQDSHSETVTLDETYETNEEAQNALSDFENTYDNVTGEITHYTTTEETGKIIEELVDTTTTTNANAYTFDNEADANTKKEELESSADGKYVQISVTINHNIVDTGEDETLTINKQFATKEEAEAYLAQLVDDGYEIIDSSITQDSHSETVTLDKTFETKEAAENALSDFENTYNNVTSDGVKENKTDTVIETINGNQAYNTKDAAEAALETFLNDPNNETDEFYFTGEVIGPTGTGEYETTQINEKFSSEAEAQAFLENLEAEGYTIVSYAFTKDTQSQTGSIEQKYNTMEEAEAALANFTNEYPDNVQSNIETIPSGTVYESTTITEDMKIYQIGSTTFVIIKHGHDVYVWTENPLTDEEIVQFKNTYKEIATDSVLTGDVVASNSTIFISGYEDVIEHNGKHFRFIKNDDNEIVIDMDSGGESRVVAGTFEPVIQYLLTASGIKNIELESGTLTGQKQKEILGYFINLAKKAKTYSVSASGTETVLDDSYTLDANASKDIMKDEYSLDVTTTENSYTTYPETYEKDWYKLIADGTKLVMDDTYTLKATAKKPIMVDEYTLDVTTEEKHYNYHFETYEKDWYNLIVKATIPEKEITPEPTPEKKETPKHTKEYSIPQTGDTNDILPLAGLATASLALAGFSLVKRKRRR